MWRLIALLILLPTLTEAEGFKHRVKSANAPPLPVIELYCTDTQGQRRELGEVVCIIASSCQQMLAKCDMSQNNVMWRQIQEGCPGASLTPSLTDRLDGLMPPQYSIPVYPKV